MTVYCKDCVFQSGYDGVHYCTHKSCYERYYDEKENKTKVIRILDDYSKNKKNDCIDFKKKEPTFWQKVLKFLVERKVRF